MMAVVLPGPFSGPVEVLVVTWRRKSERKSPQFKKISCSPELKISVST